MCTKCVYISEYLCCDYHFRLLIAKCFKQDTVFVLTMWLHNTMYIKGKLTVEDKGQLLIMI
jgi:hypothetical protein